MTDDKPTNTISLVAERRTREAGARFRGRARSLDQRVGGHWGAAREGQRNRRRPVVDRLVVPPGHGDPRPLGPGAERGGRRRAAPCSPPASPALPPTTPRGQAKRHRVATRLLAMAGDLANQRPSP